MEPHQHNIIFENTKEAAQTNSNILQRTNYDFEQFIVTQKNTILTPGSEFRSINTLGKLLGNHQDWQKIKKQFMKVVTSPPNRQTYQNLSGNKIYIQ